MRIEAEALRELLHRVGERELVVQLEELDDVATGAATAVFSVVNTVLLQPLPFNGAERIVAVDLSAEKPEVREKYLMV